MTDLKISCELNQSRKKELGINYGMNMNFGYGSHTVTLVSLDEGLFKFLKTIFYIKVGDKQLNDNYLDKIHWLILQI